LLGDTIRNSKNSTARNLLVLTSIGSVDDETMRRRFPEYFGEQEQPANGGGKPVTRTETKPATVVASASRSTSSKKIVLKQSQVLLAKKLGLTPEQYAREMRKLEN
jgi:predicted Zn-dependent peptidase